MNKIMIFPGHGVSENGGYDPGAVNERLGVCEASMVLGVINNMRVIWDSLDRRKPEVRFSPPTSLTGKILMVNSENPDFAVDVHLNSLTKPIVRGTEVLYYPGSERGKAIARVFQRHLVRMLVTPNRGIEERVDLGFLKKTRCPAIITESEFISNEEVALALSQGTMTWEIALAHVKAILEIAGMGGE